MVQIQHAIGAAPFLPPGGLDYLSVLSYNVLLPNSVDGWWNYKMYSPSMPADVLSKISCWEYRKNLLRDRISALDADVVCLQEVAPVSFDDDFAFMAELGYDGKEMFKRGRFRPATFWKTSTCELVSEPVHKDRSLLTAFRKKGVSDAKLWYVLNVHLQAGQEARRRVRQINEGCRAVLTLARKLNEPDPEKSARLIVCGDFNGGEECGAVSYLEKGYVDETFREDGEPVVSGRKDLPLSAPLRDVAASVSSRSPPATLVVSELISLLVEGEAYENPRLSTSAVEILNRVYDKHAQVELDGDKVMGYHDVTEWLTLINKEVGRGSEFREAARQMGWKEDEANEGTVELPRDGVLTREGFVQVYEKELRQGKFWGIAYDLGILDEPLPNIGIFEGRYDRMYCSDTVEIAAVRDFVCSEPCPNTAEPSDHLPVAACFTIA